MWLRWIYVYRRVSAAVLLILLKHWYVLIRLKSVIYRIIIYYFVCFFTFCRGINKKQRVMFIN